MTGFIFALGIIVIAFGAIGGIIVMTETGPFGIVYIVSSLITGSLLIGFSKLLEKITSIHDFLVDETFPISNHNTFGLNFRIQAVRYKGKFGGSYQIQGVELVKIDPTFKDKESFTGHVFQTLRTNKT